MKHLKIRLGQEHNVVLTAISVPRVEGNEPIYHCKIKTSVGSLQFSTESNYTHSQLQSFLTELDKILRTLKGKCSLTPYKSGSAEIYISVGNKGHIITQVKGSKYIFKQPENSDWKSKASFYSYAENYFNIIHKGKFNN